MLKNSIAISALVSFTLAVSVRAQQGPAVPPPSVAATSGPTMEQTIAFLNGLLTKQGEFELPPGMNFTARIMLQQVQLQAPCTLDVHTTRRDTDDTGHTYSSSFRYLLDLEKTDPKSLQVSKQESKQHPGTVAYDVTMDRASWRQVPLENPTDANPPLLTKGTYGILLTKQQNNIYVFQTEDTNQRYPFWVTNATGLRVQHGDVTVQGATFNDVHAGDPIFVDVSGQKNGFAIASTLIDFGASDSLSKFDHLVFNDSDRTERAAKALIHAMVLCHKADEPSLF
jgi:hypothetical protein